MQKVQSNDEFMTEIRERIKNKPQTEFASSQEGTLEFKRHTYVPDGPNFIEQLLEEAHQTPYSVYPIVTKMYQDLKRRYWWLGMKKDVIRFVERCLTHEERCD